VIVEIPHDTDIQRSTLERAPRSFQGHPVALRLPLVHRVLIPGTRAKNALEPKWNKPLMLAMDCFS
jgi:hypothetical protein